MDDYTDEQRQSYEWNAASHLRHLIRYLNMTQPDWPMHEVEPCIDGQTLEEWWEMSETYRKLIFGAAGSAVPWGFTDNET